MPKTYNSILNYIEDVPKDIYDFANSFRSVTSYNTKSIYNNKSFDKSLHTQYIHSNIKKDNNSVDSNIYIHSKNTSGDINDIMVYVKKYWWIPVIALVLLFLMNE